ncbi:MAG: transposase [Phycisphaerae bacterium]
MKLWREWYRCVSALRASCSRSASFAWMLVALAGLTIRTDLLGVTSIVRALALWPSTYPRLLHMFHSNALNLDLLTRSWVDLVFRLFRAVTFHDRVVLIVDGIKVAKEGRRMPGVKRLHQSSGNNSKPPYIRGHSFEAVSLLVENPCSGGYGAIPLLSRIQEGVEYGPGKKRSLLDKCMDMMLPLTQVLKRHVYMVADAYYASRKIIDPLLAHEHHLVTRVRTNAVAYKVPAKGTARRRRGRPRTYGAKVLLRSIASGSRGYTKAGSPLSDEAGEEILYRHMDLIWMPVKRVVRFVVVKHPIRGTIVLLSTDLDLEPLEILTLYASRFKIEYGFRQAIHTLGSYAYHFWMKGMDRLPRNPKDQILHRKSKRYRDKVARKIDAYHRFVQLGCIAQGLLLHLGLNRSKQVWRGFKGWLRTENRNAAPSEWVVATSLRDTLPAFLRNTPGGLPFVKNLRLLTDRKRCPRCRRCA